MGLPSISICILNYNYGRYLGQAIDSALRQEPGAYRIEEVIVVDDGSTDDSMEVCAHYGDRITVLRRKHQGFGAVLTAAVRAARGDWIATLDADDWFTEDKLATAAQFMSGECHLIQHWEHVVGTDGLPLVSMPHPGGNTSTLLVRRAAALDLLPVSNEAFFHVFDYLGFGVKLTDPLVNYRLHDANMTDRTNPGIFQDYLANVDRDIAGRLRELSFSPPSWSSDRPLRRLSRHFSATARGHIREAAVQRGERAAALTAWAGEMCMAIAARRTFTPHFAGAKSVLHMEPLVIVGRPPERTTGTN